ncbi:MAG: hypothetical protein WBV94_27355 [Blastocatellia bacterium]
MGDPSELKPDGTKQFIVEEIMEGLFTVVNAYEGTPDYFNESVGFYEEEASMEETLPVDDPTPASEEIQQELRERILRQVISISQIDDKQERLEQSIRSAKEFRSQYPISNELLSQIKKEIEKNNPSRSPFIILNYEIITGLAGEQAFYYRGVVTQFTDRSGLNLLEFIKAVNESKEEGITPGEVAKQVLSATTGKPR